MSVAGVMAFVGGLFQLIVRYLDWRKQKPENDLIKRRAELAKENEDAHTKGDIDRMRATRAEIEHIDQQLAATKGT